MSATRWSTVLAAIVKDGGPITAHPDAETLRLRGERRLLARPPVVEPKWVAETPFVLDEEPPAPIPARPYTPPVTLQPTPPSRRGWRRFFRRAA